ncbi:MULTISPECIES: TIM barrel protein [unclassified Mycobacterium]|uniref:TIM barrel protein n=1 Tax=unclassified Mycobacterium TaxID=2642494 RepID=UPI0007400EE5|nr:MULTISPECIES: TIM barrel protein [unclassified Mycobacterium]KUH84940.1 hypothetical protein AU185_00125 [Mycobacterium sp. GA-0227b]KUH87458.1 hypothetical protein AU186_02345 [Mycobacterium sp. GA-1999]KUH90365.1 hypothetical protein AU187_22855 [Mycobacterium sp. IS-1556]
MTVHLALTPDARWSCALPDLLAAARTTGFASVGINADQSGSAASAFTAAGVPCHEVLALVIGDEEAAALSAAERLAECAALVGAPWVLTVFAAPPRMSLIRQCARIIGAAGAAMAVEFSPLGPVSVISDGMAVVRAAQRDAPAGLLIDSWHFCMGRSTWADLATVPLDDIAYLQFTDALAPESADRLVRETLHRRTLPGEGVLELDRFAGILLDRGWGGVVSMEILSAALRALPLESMLRRVYDAGASFWR